MAEDRPVDELVTWQLEGGIGTITLDRPDKKNALTFDMRDRLRDLFEVASEDLRVRVVVLTGAGSAFCAGADVGGGSSTVAPPRPDDAPERAVGDVARLVERGWQRLIAAIQDCEKPVVAAVNGVAAGGGMQLAVASDLVVMSDDARMISAFVRRGIMPDAGAAWLLARLVGPQRAKHLMFLGDDVSAAEAVELGLALQAVPADELAATVDALARRLADAPTRALAYTKALVNRATESDRRTAFREEAHLQELVQATHDAQEGLQSFVERRPAQFRGF